MYTSKSRPILSFVSILILWFSYCDCSLLSKSFKNLKIHFERHTLKRNIQRTLPSPWLYNSVQTKYIQQDLDHFDSQLDKKFLQRYYVSDRYWRRPNGPVFLYIGGEGQLVPEALLGGEIVNLALKYGALLFAVEHRYYGLSVPDDGLQLKNMHFLSSQQALADLSFFHEYAVKSYNLTKQNRWIAYGGSYPGSLSAWLRSKFPHIAFGSIASSAPVFAKENFEGYNKVVADSLAAASVGGSKKCQAAVRDAFAVVDALIAGGHFEKLKEDFRSCNNISNANDTSLFAQNLAGIFMGVVQYNNEEEGLNIRKVCKFMTDEKKTVYDRLRDVNMAYLQEVGESCNDNSFQKYVADLKKDTIDPTGVSASRQWFFQTCSEFGYYQTCDRTTSCVFAHHMNLQDYADICQIVFHIPRSEIERRVSFTNDYYGGKSPDGTRIVFVNGSIDPWHWLSVLPNSTSTEEVSIYIPGTAHCANMESPSPKDPKALSLAREEVKTIIGHWLTLGK